MDSQEELLSFLDLMDLDEDLIDAPLRYLMGRNKYSTKHLKNAIQLLQYKALINSQEGTECDNEHEFDFAVKLLKDLDTTNIDYACKIINIVLCLNTDKIVSKAEHLLQQILSEIEFRSETPTSGFPETDKYTKILLILKASDSILNATIKNGEKLSMIFLETPLEKVLDTPDEKLKIYFLTNTVPRFMEGVVGYNILIRIWIYLKYLKRIRKEDALKIFGCLSDYYLPSPEGKGDIKFVSQIVFEYDFWDIVLYGLTSDDTSLRKISVYLSKKAIDYVIFSNTNLDVKFKDHTIFEWKINNSKKLKRMWDNFFILIDSLEEKQGNIVLPSLKLFESIQIGNCWLNAAFHIGLKHDNTQVRLKCIEYKLKTEIGCPGDAEALLGALNDINIYDQTLYNVNKILKEGMKNLLQYTHSFMNIVRAIPKIKWSPVPFYLLTEILSELNNIISKENKPEIIKLITDILKVPCNSVVLRKGVHLNIAHFVSKCCGNLDPKDVANIYDVIQLKTSSEINKENPFNSVVKHISLQKEDKANYLKLWSEKNSYIDLIIMYLYNNEEDIPLLADIINEKLRNINGGVSRQYANKTDTLKDVIFLMHMSNKTKNRDSNLHSINEIISSQNKILLQYILSIFSSNIIITGEHAIALFEKHNLQFAEKDLGETLLQIYMTSLLFLNNNSELDKAVFSMCAIKMLHKNPIMLSYYKHEMLNLKKIMDLVSTLQFNDFQNESVGKLKNLLYEQYCQIIYILIEQGDKIEPCKDDLINLIEHMLECGGYGCLKWILKIMNKVIIHIDNNDNFNMTQFINRVWNEIEELKSNNQYSPCIEEFVDLITQDGLLQKSMYNNIIISYCNKIIEYGPVKTNPLYYLIRKLNTKDFKDYVHLVYVLCEILLYCPVPRKDQRITDNLTLEVMENVCFGINKYCNDVHFNYEIQWLSISTLCSISDLETLQIIANFITSRIDNTFKNRQRYHGNSQMHRVLQTSLQHLLILVLKGVNVGNILKWCFNLLVKLPHQPSVRTCLDWIISLHFYIQKIDLTEEMLQTLKSNNVPLNSQFFILYWILKHKITNNTYSEEEYNCVLDFLLSHTMGQIFNVRLNAQYLAITLYKLANKQTKFQYTIEIIEKTFSESSNDKNFTKLTSDYFTNKFDIVANLSPYFIYYLLPKVCEVDNNEKVDLSFVKNVTQNIKSIIGPNVSNEFINEWKKCDKIDETFNDSDLVRRDHSNVIEDSEGSGTIQKKYVPWKNMSDVNLYDIEKKRESPSQLIVVASLIDKLPNLGGMARTSEVFGVQTYVVDSLRHLQDKQFQGLSVSAERWINVEEVRPGRPLKDYLMKKKEEGYSVVAAEQTSTSSKLQSFKFPKKTILLLGHEKEGVPCDLLPIMDHCVEIPQQGYVRSLNVHVTAAIFVWEYARQNVL